MHLNAMNLTWHLVLPPGLSLQKEEGQVLGTVKVKCLRAISPQDGAGKLLLHPLPRCSTQKGVQFSSLFYWGKGVSKYSH